MISYNFEQGILFITFSDEVNVNDISNFLKEFSELKDLPEHLLLLYDLLNADLLFSTEEIDIISQFADLSTQKYLSVKTAFLVNDPKLTAYSTLFSDLADTNKTSRKLFSTKNAAIRWLKPNN